MERISKIEYDNLNQDFVINGIRLLSHLCKHEGINPKSYTPSILFQSKSVDRLRGNGNPDLSSGYSSIYLCSECGGYDGNPIGVKVIISNDVVKWSSIGIYEDFEEGLKLPFKKVREFNFNALQYSEFISIIEKAVLGT